MTQSNYNHCFTPIEVSHLRQREGYLTALTQLGILAPQLEEVLTPFYKAELEFYEEWLENDRKSSEIWNSRYAELKVIRQKETELNREYEADLKTQSQALDRWFELSIIGRLFTKKPEYSVRSPQLLEAIETRKAMEAEYGNIREKYPHGCVPRPESYLQQFVTKQAYLERKLAIAMAAESPYLITRMELNEMLDWEMGVNRIKIEKVIDLAKTLPPPDKSKIRINYSHCRFERIEREERFKVFELV